MYIINVIPLIKIPRPNPQILSYFLKENLSRGALVQISLRKKKINALVFSSENLEKKKLDIKKSASFKLKPVEKVISKNPVLTKQQFSLLLWFSKYYFSPLGLVARLFVPQNLIIAKKPRDNYEVSLIKNQVLILTPETKRLVFAPLTGLKSIIVESEDSSKYISWGRQPYYDTRKIAFQLAKIFKTKITLKSALPSVETYYWAKKQKYQLKVHDSKFMIHDSKLIDMREEIKKGNYSILSKKLQEEIKKNKKIILYISRRGTSSFILCRDCGHVLKCPHCDVPMILHRAPIKLLCHHCNNEEIPPTLCPNCRGYKIKYFGAGTQKAEAEVKKIFPASPTGGPKAKVFRLDSDVSKTPIQQQKIINDFNKSKDAILIGTKMLIEKNIKPVNLMGVISIETMLNLPDYRSSERVFQTLNQLKKLSKRQFLVQTYNPDNLAIKSIIDNKWKNFYNEEIKIRKALSYPPFSQIIKLSFEHKNSQKAEQEAKILLEKLKIQLANFSAQGGPASGWQLLGPVPAFIPKVARKYKYHIIIKCGIKNIRKRNKLLIIIPSTWKIEVNPESLL